MQSADPSVWKCCTLFAVHMAPESTHCLGISAPGCAQAATSPIIGWTLDPAGLAGATGVNGREAGAARGTACAGGIAQIPCSPKGHSLTFMLLAADFSLLLTQSFIPFQGGQGGSISFVLVVPRSPTNTCSRSSSLIAPALGAAQTSNTYCVLCSGDFTRQGGCRFVCADPQSLCRQSVHSQHTGKSFPQQGYRQKGICNTTAPSGGGRQTTLVLGI